jgi:hypothetical protein
MEGMYGIEIDEMLRKEMKRIDEETTPKLTKRSSRLFGISLYPHLDNLRATHVMPGLRGTPAGMMTTSAPLSASATLHPAFSVHSPLYPVDTVNRHRRSTRNAQAISMPRAGEDRLTGSTRSP